ncbi:MAG: ABC transporter ATP-binding protein [Siculibacillus sp.]
MTADVLVSARGLVKIYPPRENPVAYVAALLFGETFVRGHRALDGVDVEVRRGECLGIVGRNGAGKSTLLQLLCGTHAVSAGTVETRGRIAAMLALGAGFNPDFTGRENVRLAASVYGLTDREIDRRFDTIAAFADIGDFLDQPVREYSSGMYARLAFSVCAHVDADVLVVDEVLGVGDAAFQAKCRRFFEAFLKRGAVIFVSHDESAVLSVCSRAIWLERGRLMAEGSPSDVLGRYNRAIAEEYGATPTEGALVAGPDRPSFAYDDPMRGRNPIEVTPYDRDAPAHGYGGATIDDVHFVDADGRRIDRIEGGEMVRLRITGPAVAEVSRPVIGFLLRDGTGQNYFGDNTFLAYRTRPRQLAPGDRFEALFEFRMPYLPLGVYGLTPSIIDGTQQSHVHVFWTEEAVRLIVERSPVAFGKAGTVMHVEPPRVIAPPADDALGRNDRVIEPRHTGAPAPRPPPGEA